MANTSGIGIFGSTSSISFDDPGVVAKVKTGKDLIAEAIHRIINTRPGERLRDPYFGSRIKEILFEQNDFFTQRTGALFLRMAIETFEPRVDVQDVQVTGSGNQLTIKAFFRIRADYQHLLVTTVKVLA